MPSPKGIGKGHFGRLAKHRFPGKRDQRPNGYRRAVSRRLERTPENETFLCGEHPPRRSKISIRPGPFAPPKMECSDPFFPGISKQLFARPGERNQRLDWCRRDRHFGGVEHDFRPVQVQSSPVAKRPLSGDLQELQLLSTSGVASTFPIDSKNSSSSPGSCVSTGAQLCAV